MELFSIVELNKDYAGIQRQFVIVIHISLVKLIC